MAVEVFLTFAGEGENQHAVSGVNILVGEVHAVAVESPVTFAPAGAIERIEIVGPVERKVAAAFALARRVLINFDPVDELEKRKLRFIKLANPSRTLRRPKVKTESLCTCQVGNLATFRLADFLAVYSPADVIRSPFETVGVECLIGGGANSMVLFACYLRACLTGNDVGLKTVRVLAENFDIHFYPGPSISDFGAILVEEHGTDCSRCGCHLHTGFELAVLNFF